MYRLIILRLFYEIILSKLNYGLIRMFQVYCIYFLLGFII